MPRTLASFGEFLVSVKVDGTDVRDYSTLTMPADVGNLFVLAADAVFGNAAGVGTVAMSLEDDTKEGTLVKFALGSASPGAGRSRLNLTNDPTWFSMVNLEHSPRLHWRVAQG